MLNDFHDVQILISLKSGRGGVFVEFFCELCKAMCGKQLGGKFLHVTSAEHSSSSSATCLVLTEKRAISDFHLTIRMGFFTCRVYLKFKRRAQLSTFLSPDCAKLLVLQSVTSEPWHEVFIVQYAGIVAAFWGVWLFSLGMESTENSKGHQC